MPNFYEDNDDLRWWVEHGLDWAPLVHLTEFGRPEGDPTSFYRDVLELVGRFVAEEVAPHWRALDQAHPRLVDGEVVSPPVFEDIFEKIRELQLHGLCVPRELGGLNAPVLLLHLNSELFARAEVSVCAHHGFHGGMAMAALSYSLLEGTTKIGGDPPGIQETRFREMIDSIVAGEAWGSMDITEPHAGSDMGALRCKGEVDVAGNWTVSGQKVFITSGHGRWHFVIARTAETTGSGAFDGLAGLSMLLVEKGPEVSVVGVEDKLGHNGSATCAVSFEGAPAHLIGAPGDGFRMMLLLMNNARVGVGFECLGLCEAAYRQAAAFAADRHSMGRPIARHELLADQLDEMRTDIQVIRALCMTAGWHEEMAQKLDIQEKHLPPGDPAALRRHRRKARVLTPLLKYHAAEKAVEMARRNIQIHGGAGYLRESGAEKLLRDAVVMPIYEGTSQIQALMAMKDTLLGAVRDPARFVRGAARARWRAVSSRDELERGVARVVVAKHQAVQHLLGRLAAAKLRELRHVSPADWGRAFRDFDPKKDFALALLHAERLCRLLIDAESGEILLDCARRFPERRELALRWLERAEPRVRGVLDEIVSRSPGWLGAEEPVLAAAAK